MTFSDNIVPTLYDLFLAASCQFTTDTRHIKDGDLFFALKGENFNGNQFAKSALDNGAAHAIVDEDVDTDNSRTIRCDDVLNLMQQLATHHRRQFDIPVLAIGGSNGKTTTKELVSNCLGKSYIVHSTTGNFNNQIGVPITLLSMPLSTEIAVVEIGTNSFGEIDFLCGMIEPNFGIITNIGKEHLKGFGNLEGVAKEESALYNFLHKHNGFAFVNLDDRYLARMSHRLELKRTYSTSQKADDDFEVINLLPQLKLTSGISTFTSNLQGLHNAQNMAAAISISRHFKIPEDAIGESLASYRPSNNRSEWREIGSNSFLLDAYNANPSSMMAVLETFSAADHKAKVILLGDMFELGSTALGEHEAIARNALKIPNSVVILTGPIFSKLGSKLGIKVFADVKELNAHLHLQNYEDTWFLIKGSRGMKMERVMEVFSD